MAYWIFRTDVKYGFENFASQLTANAKSKHMT